jgi:hypothetical protein
MEGENLERNEIGAMTSNFGFDYRNSVRRWRQGNTDPEASSNTSLKK